MTTASLGAKALPPSYDWPYGTGPIMVSTSIAIVERVIIIYLVYTLAQRYTRRGVRNMLPPGTVPKDDRGLRQTTNLLNHFKYVTEDTCSIPTKLTVNVPLT